MSYPLTLLYHKKEQSVNSNIAENKERYSSNDEKTDRKNRLKKINELITMKDRERRTIQILRTETQLEQGPLK